MSAVVSACRLVAAAEQRAHYANSVATRILVTLNREPQSLDTIVWAVDAPRTTVARYLADLAEAELALHVPGGWVSAWASGHDAGEAER
jgi:hypothetical protein